jgi:hypothetical protein
MRKRLLAGLLVVMSFGVCADTGEADDFAQHEELEEHDEDIEGDSDLPDWTVDKVTPVHETVSRWVDNTARGIDGFFGTEDHLYTRNRSFLRLSQEFEWLEGDDMDHDTRVRFRLDLPTTKERLRLIIESDPDETQGTLTEQQASRIRPDQRDSGNSIIGLSQGIGEEDRTLGWDTNASAGIRFRFPLDPYVRLTAERLWDIGAGPWQLESFNRASWFNSNGYSGRTRLDIGRPVDENRHLRFVTNIQWQERYDTLEFAESVELFHVLGRRSALRYAAIAAGSSLSQPRMNDYILLTQYRRNLHRDILFFDAVPELRFSRDSNFDARWALTLRVEIYFRGQLRDRRRNPQPDAGDIAYAPDRIMNAFNPGLEASTAAAQANADAAFLQRHPQYFSVDGLDKAPLP